MSRVTRSLRDLARRRRPSPAILVAGAALFLALGGSAVAATGLIQASDIAPGAVTGKAIRSGAVEPKDLSTATRALVRTGVDGAAGAGGGNGAPGTGGSNGAPGIAGSNGAPGTAGSNGANGPNGANGTNGIDGSDGANGVDGTNGIDGTDGIDGTIAPLSATAPLVELPTGAPLTPVVSLAVPAGNYVILAKTELSHTGAGDTVECVLKAGTTTVDQVAMKTLPALAAIPASLQAVVKVTSPSQVAVECKVKVANGSATFNSLIAIPTA
jgi:Collagen triple helix repeat (20 copies)